MLFSRISLLGQIIQLSVCLLLIPKLDGSSTYHLFCRLVFLRNTTIKIALAVIKMARGQIWRWAKTQGNEGGRGKLQRLCSVEKPEPLKQQWFCYCTQKRSILVVVDCSYHSAFFWKKWLGKRWSLVVWVGESVVVSVAVLNAIRASIHPQACVFDDLLAGRGDTCSRSSRQTYLFTAFDFTSLYMTSQGKEYERNQSANKLRLLSQRMVGEKGKRKTWATLDFDRIFMCSLTKICIVIADSWWCFYSVVHFGEMCKM